MGKKNAARLAEILRLSTITNGPFRGAGVAGVIDGYPVAAAWTQREKRSTVGFLVRFKKGSLQASASDFASRITAAPDLREALGPKTSAGKKRAAALTIATNGILFYWDYAFLAHKPEVVARILGALVSAIKGQAAPVGTDCEVCGSAHSGDICSGQGTLSSVCAGCRQRMEEEDRRKVEEYEARESNPLLGTAAGIAAAAGGALLWGGVAYALQRIFLYGGILIGIGIAWAVNKGMGKINLYGRILTVALTLGSVLMGDFVFMCLAAARELKTALTPDLAFRLAPHFVQFELADKSGPLSLLFGVVGAVFILFANRPPAFKRVMVPLG